MERNLPAYIKPYFSLKFGLILLMLLVVSQTKAAIRTASVSGNWNDPVTWGGFSIPIATDDVLINCAVTLPANIIANCNNLNINNFSSLTVYGELTVNGNLTMDNNGSALNLMTGCQVLVKGNVALQNQVSIDISSYFIVYGNFTKSGSGNQGEIAISSAHVYIFGAVSTPWTNFTGCDAAYAGTTNTVADGCDYGNLDAFINNGVGSVVPETFINTTNLTPSTAWYCAGGNVTLTIGEAGTISMLKWYNGTTLLSTINSPASYTYIANTAGSYSAIYKVGNNLYKTNSATVASSVAPTAAISGTTSICQGNSTALTVTLGGNSPWNFTYTDGTTPVTVSNQNTSPFTVNVSPSTTKTFTLTSVSNACSSGSVSGSATITVNSIPTANAGTAISVCSNAGGVNITTGSSASNYTGVTWTSSGTGSFTNPNSLTTCLYTPSAADISAGSVTLTLTATGNSPCGSAISNKTLTIKLDGSWLGGGSDWNTGSNWDCGAIPSLTTDVTVANGKTPYPILSGGSVGTARNLTIGSSATLTITGNNLQIAGNINISPAGPITASAGTIEMKGGSPQTIPASTFAGDNLKDLIISNGTGVTLGGPLNLTGILSAVSGDLISNGNLTLISSPTQTALIDGSGSGQVTGNVTMQRYLSSGFGYKYVSSPFSDATVNEFATEVNLGAAFPTFYAYNENINTTGWVKYVTAANPLLTMAGYAANFGAGPAPITVQVSGSVNNGSKSIALSNNSQPYTKGFNLVGNPYPSPIDWNQATDWTRTNVDKAIWLFNASSTDQYGGIYSSYVNTVYSDSTTNTTLTPNIIPSMQGFFVHVTNPGPGTLGMTNKVRTLHSSPTYKAASFDSRIILRFSAKFDEKNSLSDATVLYFDPSSTPNFDSDKDALKLMNTDVTVPNLYSITPDVRQLSINGMPSPVDSLTRIPLGIKIFKDGWLNLSAKDISMLPADLNLYLLDKEKNVTQDLKKNPTYRFYLNTGEKNQRFALLFAKTNGFVEPSPPEKLFTITKIDQTLLVNINLPDNEPGKLYITNMLGQIILEKEVSNFQLIEISTGLKSGIYVVTISSGLRKQSEKIVFLKK